MGNKDSWWLSKYFNALDGHCLGWQLNMKHVFLPTGRLQEHLGNNFLIICVKKNLSTSPTPVPTLS